MPVTAVTGTDTLIINGRIITALADASAVDLTAPNDLSVVKRGKDGNLVYGKNEMGRMANMVIRLVLGSDDDKYLNSLLAQWKQSTSDFILMTGAFYKRTGDGAGGLQTKVHQLTGGVPKNFPEALTAADGNTDQSVSIWTITWGDCDISVQ